jgi:radical SAM superfamily enzyme YgiQ (UPF0313 family)
MVMKLWPSCAWRRRKDYGDFHLVLTFYQQEENYSLGLSALSAWLKRELPGLRISLLDAQAGASPAGYAERMCRLQPDLIGVSAMHPTWPPMIPFLQETRRALPQTSIIVGGYQPTFSPQDTLSQPFVDYICRGDGELPLTALIARLAHPKKEQSPIDGI